MDTVRKVYGIMMIGAMLLAGCSHDDVTVDVTPAALVPISFDCSITSDDPNHTRAVGGYAGVITKENNELRYTGFGVFAGQDRTAVEIDDNKLYKPDLM